MSDDYEILADAVCLYIEEQLPQGTVRVAPSIGDTVDIFRLSFTDQSTHIIRLSHELLDHIGSPEALIARLEQCDLIGMMEKNAAGVSITVSTRGAVLTHSSDY